MTRSTAQDELIVAAFKEWCRVHKIPKGGAIVIDAKSFFLSLGTHAEKWDHVVKVLRKKGLVK